MRAQRTEVDNAFMGAITERKVIRLNENVSRLKNSGAPRLGRDIKVLVLSFEKLEYFCRENKKKAPRLLTPGHPIKKFRIWQKDSAMKAVYINSSVLVELLTRCKKFVGIS